MKLNGRWFPQIVDRDSGNLYQYIYKKMWCSLLNLLAGDLGQPSCLVIKRSTIMFPIDRGNCIPGTNVRTGDTIVSRSV